MMTTGARRFGGLLVAAVVFAAVGGSPLPARAQGTGEAAGVPPVVWDKGLRIQTPDGKHSVGIHGAVQPQFSFLADDTGDDYDEVARFLVKRARVRVSATLFEKRVFTLFQLGFDQAEPRLFDAYADVRFLDGQLQLRLGQWRRPFLREWITPLTALEMVDRSLLTGLFNASRDVGVALHNGYETAPTVEWFLGVFNGTGDRALPTVKGTADESSGTVSLTSFTLSNTPKKMHPMVVARVAWNSEPGLGYQEMDLQGGPPRYSVALAGIFDFDGDDDKLPASLRGSLELGLKAHGLSLTLGGYAWSNAEDHPFGTQDLQRIGAGLQAGYVIAGRYQPTVRFVWAAPWAKDELGDSTIEAAVGFTWYQFANNLKWQTDFAWVRNDGGVLASGDDADDLRFRIQLQAAF
jgi:hypothetical protein